MPRTTSPASNRHGPQKLSTCGGFVTLAGKASMLDALDRALRQTLPGPLREQVRFANLRAGRLLFLASSPTWAARLRLQQTQILAAARSLGVEASVVGVRVAPLPKVEVAPVLRKQLSPKAAAHLRAAAASSADPELKALFDRLAATTDPDQANKG